MGAQLNEMNETEFLNRSVGDGGFLQSEIWRTFQAQSGRQTRHEENENWWANIAEHRLPLVGRYGYVPRGPVHKTKGEPLEDKEEERAARDPGMRGFLEDAKRAGWGWLRIEPESETILEQLRKVLKPYRLVPAPHSVQPREILVLDISPEAPELLKGMKSKTRYNIRLAEKKRVTVYQTQEKRHQEAFLRLVAVTAERDGIRSHPANYYRAMFTSFPADSWTLFVAEYAGEIVAANLIIFFGQYATYLHGASANEHREVMAPYLLQWRAIEEAKQRGCNHYDFGGVDTQNPDGSWAGITRFKLGFAPDTPTKHFPGAFDLVLRPARYQWYRALRRLRG